MSYVLLCLLLPNELHHRDNEVVSVSVCLSRVHGFMSVNKCVSIFVLISILKNKDFFFFMYCVYISNCLAVDAISSKTRMKP